jgi:hypothetical protein
MTTARNRLAICWTAWIGLLGLFLITGPGARAATLTFAFTSPGNGAFAEMYVPFTVYTAQAPWDPPQIYLQAFLGATSGCTPIDPAQPYDCTGMGVGSALVVGAGMYSTESWERTTFGHTGDVSSCAGSGRLCDGRLAPGDYLLRLAVVGSQQPWYNSTVSPFTVSVTAELSAPDGILTPEPATGVPGAASLGVLALLGRYRKRLRTRSN